MQDQISTSPIKVSILNPPFSTRNMIWMHQLPNWNLELNRWA